MTGRRKLAINRLRSNPQLDQAAAERFLARHTFPIIEGVKATFAVRVDDVDAVYLRHRVQGLPGDLALRRLPGTTVWWVVVEIPSSSRVEYQFESRRGDHWHRFNDPGNPHLARSPVGDSSVCFGDGYRTPSWSEPDPEARPGELVAWELRSVAQRRTNRVTLYLPARFRETTRYPLLVVHDGADYLEYAQMKTVLDNLIHSLDLAETVVAFTDPGERLTEYPNNAAHARWIAHELVPTLEERLPLAGRPSGRCLMGSSFGGVASLSVAHRNPGYFGSLLVQSGSFVFTDIGDDHGEDPAFDPVVAFVNRFRARPRRVVERMFVSCGVYEPLITPNRSMLNTFREAGIEVDYVESRDGHSWPSWRDRLRDGLSWIYPGPSTFVYE
ncbi:enterochelin esterase family protein [Friedmanniella endophytica]|uniref:Enterochelin esterase family protein n=1 Tax=Microlunatus kandeliicorticis TaxID=1759536 RepID=A0A7W3P5E4_9ACTN|nr:alpha/beta hydrolase-fold protein [Microlunatus kandeliicorticis]MBA8793785.1 enterochelin esterase family protein [Microlunatus kandeliicorticis]